MIATQIKPDETQTELSKLLQDVHKELIIAHHQAPKPADKKRATLEIGILLVRARAEFSSDKLYGDWVKCNIIEKCDTGIKKPTRQTLYRYQQLAKFTEDLDSFEERFKRCLDVGFTNVYKLVKEEHKGLLGEFQNGAVEAKDLDRKLNPSKYLKQQDNLFVGIKKDLINLSDEQREELLKMLQEIDS
ncbi:hypothetical protein VIN01S_08460 [Vibrio inusitatus NBRC 102082]|uniref:Uncharacterized protein n=1 Tax=Vibrio inusitatus NBRC 102082 TaxID=1219070 RepID=A0A4Y3HTG4_9VIBR|nr:hypothetical protein [Vibrio inusitatus]GEA50042.1 hypothetical protein VIN01S_08460 [Vibrio inusitatus NBRC 102082]